MKKQYEFLEIEIFDSCGDVFCGGSSEPNYGSDGMDDWGNDIWGAIDGNVFRGF